MNVTSVLHRGDTSTKTWTLKTFLLSCPLREYFTKKWKSVAAPFSVASGRVRKCCDPSCANIDLQGKLKPPLLFSDRPTITVNQCLLQAAILVCSDFLISWDKLFRTNILKTNIWSNRQINGERENSAPLVNYFNVSSGMIHNLNP